MRDEGEAVRCVGPIDPHKVGGGQCSDSHMTHNISVGDDNYRGKGPSGSGRYSGSQLLTPSHLMQCRQARREGKGETCRARSNE